MIKIFTKSIKDSRDAVALGNALSNLRSVGARNIPEPSVVKNSPNGTSWTGVKRDGDRWHMVKHGPSSYNVGY